ncbi:MAG: hypothetical protein M1812_006306 [Candelaria pacifica]|nr:MAG: hypothetical protein M1812_006306 [Candelaria pacifica]
MATTTSTNHNNPTSTSSPIQPFDTKTLLKPVITSNIFPLGTTSTTPTSEYNYKYDELQPQESVEDFERMKNKDTKLKRLIRRIRLISRISALCLSIAITALMIHTLLTFQKTRNTKRNTPSGPRTAWHADTKLWPTILCLCIASISLFLNLIIVLAYYRSVKTANKANTISTVFTGGVVGFHIVYWGVAAALYKYAKDTDGVSNDLWGWSCSNAARTIQNEFRAEVDFDRICAVQTGGWVTSLVEVGLEVFTLVAFAIAFMRVRHRKQMKVVERRSKQFLPGS